MRTRSLKASLALCALALGGCDGYRKSGDRWVYVTIDEGRGRLEHPLEGADPATFEVVSRTTYAKDARRVWNRMNVLKDADPRTFTAFRGNMWAKDATHVWVWGFAPIRGADPATFHPLKFPYARDAAHVYCGSVPMRVADPARFEVVAGSDGVRAINDPRYLEGEGFPPLEGIDQEHPAVFGDGRARDGRSHYFGAAAVEGEDYASFRWINEYYGRDRAHVFFKHRILPDADPETFKAEDSFGHDRVHRWVYGIRQKDR